MVAKPAFVHNPWFCNSDVDKGFQLRCWRPKSTSKLASLDYKTSYLSNHGSQTSQICDVWFHIGYPHWWSQYPWNNPVSIHPSIVTLHPQREIHVERRQLQRWSPSSIFVQPSSDLGSPRLMLAAALPRSAFRIIQVLWVNSPTYDNNPSSWNISYPSKCVNPCRGSRRVYVSAACQIQASVHSTARAPSWRHDDHSLVWHASLSFINIPNGHIAWQTYQTWWQW